ncbi:hypothetical protein [Microbacterium sp. Gd 4-13]|uniref:hypothetical protein n=1 Tax=Microbacterium sp. Gd 4-13 TaxID=2173179 RepID=UPI0014032010|nr:hypothetical protein [Microbacterium sp. Gd 4-13]
MDRLSFTSPAPISPADLALPPTEPINITTDTSSAYPDVRSRTPEMTPSLGRVAP